MIDGVNRAVRRAGYIHGAGDRLQSVHRVNPVNPV